MTLTRSVLGNVAGELDLYTLARVGITYPHHMVHAEKHFQVNQHRNLASTNDVFYVYVKTADQAALAHFLFSFGANGYLKAEFGGYTSTAVTINSIPKNNYIGKANPGLRYLESTTAPTGFSATDEAIVGRDSDPPASGKGSFGNGLGNAEEWILPANTEFCVKFTALMDDVDVNYHMNFYEEAPASE